MLIDNAMDLLARAGAPQSDLTTLTDDLIRAQDEAHGHERRGESRAVGGFTFTGAATGSDVADFLLGLPQSKIKVVPLEKMAERYTKGELDPKVA